ncbi:vacuolar protein sorting-associated protein 18 homolog [Macrobrachium nipponense]|uniref:vacuolar protein sorting-associated protein 18 homolog n=1 Tax=Macrobrachium nipponense TaxID=159736 RepID=UPI0030C879C7
MATIFDQYESQSQGTGVCLRDSILGTTAFKNQKLEEEAAIFLLDRRVNFSPPHPITHLVVSNHHLVLAMANKTLIRINLSNPNNLEEIDICKLALQAKIYNIFLDPTGQHLLISIVSKDGVTPVDTLYLPLRTNKPKSTYKLKGHLVTSVAWSQRNQSESVTGPILIGTSRGLLFEMELTSDERFFQSGHEEYCKQLIDFGKEKPLAISQVEYRSSPSDDLHFLVLCTTPERIYQLAGRVKSLEERPMFLSLFNNYLGLPPRFTELPSTWKNSWLQIYHSVNIPKHFAWVVEQGIYYGDVSWTGLIHEEASIQKGLNPFPASVEGSGPPCGMILCEYHLFIVWPHKIQGICILNNQVVFEGSVPEDCGKLMGIARDNVRGSIWVYAERAVFKYKVDQEGRNVWRIYLDQGNYDQAKKLCSNDSSRLYVVLLKEAQDLFEKKDYLRSAKLFAKTLTSFEEVTLKFVEVGEEEALKIYLHEKLEGLKVSEQTQVTLVVVWLLELYLKKLGNLRDAGEQNTQVYRNYDEQLKAFLQDPKVRQSIINNSSAVYELLSSHDDHDNYVNVSIMLKDYDRVLRHLIHHGRYIEALEVLSNQGSEKLFCQHIPTLMKEIPREAVDCLISQGRRLSPVQLLPILVHCHSCHGHGKEVLRYIEYCVDKLDVTDEVVHNFLISLYVSERPDKLLPYFKLQGDDSQSVHYDLKFALRECISAGEEKACVHILTTMGLYQDAVELALKLDTILAKSTANRPKYDQDLRKKLWLMIAAHVVQEEQDVSRAMDVLRECDLIKIEDILPFFPDFVTIDQFKDAICSSLQEYNQHIEDLKHEMDDAAKTAENIRKDIQKFKQKFSFVHAQDRCCECNYPLLTRPFYLFPCSHKFHQDCLSDAVLGYLSETRRKRVSDLKGKLLAISNDESTTGTGVWGDREQIQSEIDSLVAGECLYCGDNIVSNIDTPFINANEWDATMAEWQ